jgi:hypothetical protein
MPTLVQTLPTNDPAFLRIVAEGWGLDETSNLTAETLAASLLDPSLAREIQETLPSDARAALEALRQSGGRLPWSIFVRRFGEMRNAGPGCRDREQHYLHPISPVETLYYRALIARAFFDTPSGPQEFAYIPDDLLPLIIPLEGEPVAVSISEPLGRPASPKERQYPRPASDRILDDLTTALAALRMGLDIPHAPHWNYSPQVLRDFLEAAGLIVNGTPRPESIRAFLETERPQALNLLFKSWRESKSFNELRQMTGLVFEGEWKNDPLETRRRLMDLFSRLPRGQWWSLPAFIRHIKEKFPDFQRPAGDYDSWFIRRSVDGTYLRGFEHWDEVDGALVRYFICGPLSWLGMVDLACAEEGGPVTAFRIVEKRLFSKENGKLTVLSNGRVCASRSLPRVSRYLLARFCEWDDEKPDEYCYRISTRSLKKAQEEGLKVSQLLSLLAKNSAAQIPPILVQALKRWENKGTEARVETHSILRVSRPEVLEELRRSKAGRFLAEPLGPTAVIVKRGAVPQVLAALTELGLLAEVQADS